MREYIWLGNLPIAIVNKAGAAMTTYYVHAGHLNQPLVVTDGAKTKVWDATLEAFGAARLFTTTVEMNLRLPGQYFHAESALAQNWMRDYDPALGRYIQPDPIGLEGGPNVYGYVGQDPLNAVDPRGEDAWLVSRRLPGTHGSHMFVVVAPALGAPPEARFSYGPSGPMWNPGLLVPLTGGNNGTNRDDRDAWAALAGCKKPEDISYTPINAPDPVVIAAGRAVDAGLMGNPTPYGVLPPFAPTSPYGMSPWGPAANSNSAAYAVAHDAAYSGTLPGTPGGLQGRPPGAYTPGWEYHGLVPRRR